MLGNHHLSVSQESFMWGCRQTVLGEAWSTWGNSPLTKIIGCIVKMGPINMVAGLFFHFIPINMVGFIRIMPMNPFQTPAHLLN